MLNSPHHLRRLGKITAKGAWVLWLGIALAPTTAPGSGGSGIFFESTEQRYETGKYIYHRKLVCSQCPYREYDFTAPGAADILPELRYDGTIGRTLSGVDRQALVYFLDKRFGLRAGT